MLKLSWGCDNFCQTSVQSLSFSFRTRSWLCFCPVTRRTTTRRIRTPPKYTKPSPIWTLPYPRGNLLKIVLCVSVWHQNMLFKYVQNSSKLTLLQSRCLASRSKKHTGPPPRPLCFAWQVFKISSNVTHWLFLNCLFLINIYKHFFLQFLGIYHYSYCSRNI